MSSDQYDVVVAEYLQEIEQRLHGLPVLQRRELLGDLEAHIATERAERGVSSEADLLHVLERLGAPAVVAAAAYEEAGLPQPAVPAAAVGSAPGPAAVAPGGTVTFAASSRFSGWAERTASIGGAAAPASDVPSPAPASVVRAPASVVPPASASVVRAPASVVPPASASVMPPPKDLRPTRPGPFPPGGPLRGPGGPGRPGAGPPFVGGPPLAPPPPAPADRPDSGAWIRVAIAGAVVLVLFLVLGCLAGSFLLASGETDPGPAVVPAEPPRPADPIEIPTQ